MNMPFKSPQEAIDACEAESLRAWQEYLVTNKLDPEKSPKACAAAHRVFHAGYIAGAKWVSGAIIEKMMANDNPNLIW